MDNLTKVDDEFLAAYALLCSDRAVSDDSDEETQALNKMLASMAWELIRFRANDGKYAI